MPEHRYIIAPGYIRSKNDGDLHWITAGKLAQLYKVSLSAPNVVIYDSRRLETTKGFRDQEGDVWLDPQPDGDYEPPY